MKEKASDANVHKLIGLWLKWQEEDEVELARTGTSENDIDDFNLCYIKQHLTVD